jgi:hypothetical protein
MEEREVRSSQGEVISESPAHVGTMRSDSLTSLTPHGHGGSESTTPWGRCRCFRASIPLARDFSFEKPLQRPLLCGIEGVLPDAVAAFSGRLGISAASDLGGRLIHLVLAVLEFQ